MNEEARHAKSWTFSVSSVLGDTQDGQGADLSGEAPGGMGRAPLNDLRALLLAHLHHCPYSGKLREGQSCRTRTILHGAERAQTWGSGHLSSSPSLASPLAGRPQTNLFPSLSLSCLFNLRGLDVIVLELQSSPDVLALNTLCVL